MEKPSTKKPMNVLKTMVFLKNFMERQAKLNDLIIGKTYLWNGNPKSEIIYKGTDEKNYHIFAYKNNEKFKYKIREKEISEYIIYNDNQLTLNL